MRYTLILILILLITSFTACERSVDDQEGMNTVEFDQEQWQLKERRDYPHRDKMVEEVLYSKEIRKLSKQEMLHLLGEPDRSDSNFLYYTIKQDRLGGFFPLHTKTLVIKYKDEEDAVEWIKLHE